MAQTTVIRVKIFSDVACEKLLNLGNVLRSYSKKLHVFMDHGVGTTYQY